MGSEPPKAAVKRQRSENWLEEDKIILKELVRERVSIIENKSTDSNTNARKVAAWNDLRTSFNNIAKAPRSLQQIKAQWGIIKMTEKKKKFIERKERFQTGGGPPPASEPPSGEDIAVWLPNEFTVDSNEFDSDSLNILDDKSKILCEKHPQENAQELALPDAPLPCVITEIEMLEPSTSTQHTTTTKPKPKTLCYRPKNKKINTSKDKAVLKIAETETACRQELHEAQMANEKQKLKNLLLKEEVLKWKLNYYKNKSN